MNGSVAISDVDESMLQRRDEMLAPVEEQLARKLKRVLQDEQNELLDRIRVTTGALSGLAHDAAAHASRYAAAATPLLVEAIREGASFANPASPCPDGLDQEATPLASALAEEVAGPLNSRIADLLSDASQDADTPVAVLSQPENRGKLALFAGIDDVRFKRVVRPGEVLTLECQVETVRGPVGRGRARATVDGSLAVRGTLTFAVGAVSRLRRQRAGRSDPEGRALPNGPDAPSGTPRLPLRAPPRLVSVRASCQRPAAPPPPAARASGPHRRRGGHPSDPPFDPGAGPLLHGLSLVRRDPPDERLQRGAAHEVHPRARLHRRVLRHPVGEPGDRRSHRPGLPSRRA